MHCLIIRDQLPRITSRDKSRCDLSGCLCHNVNSCKVHITNLLWAVWSPVKTTLHWDQIYSQKIVQPASLSSVIRDGPRFCQKFGLQKFYRLHKWSIKLCFIINMLALLQLLPDVLHATSSACLIKVFRVTFVQLRAMQDVLSWWCSRVRNRHVMDCCQFCAALADSDTDISVASFCFVPFLYILQPLVYKFLYN